MFPQKIYIQSNGNATTCGSDAYGENVFSSLIEHPISVLWKQHLHHFLNGSLFKSQICRHCITSPCRYGSISSSPEQLASWQSWTDRFPDTIQIEVSTTCNYGCCISKEIRKIRPRFIDLFKISPNIKPWLNEINRLHLWGFGEPLIHKDLPWFIQACREASQRVKLVLSTNGILLNQAMAETLIKNRVDHITFSVHGGPGTQNMLKYSKYGANYDRVIKNIEELQKLKRSHSSRWPVILLKAVLFNWNDAPETMEQFRQDALRLGLSAASGDEEIDGYGWVLDGNVGGRPLSSKKYTLNSSALQTLNENKEQVI